MEDFWAELKKRNVVRVGIAYVLVSWILIHVIHFLFPEKGPLDEIFTNFYIFLAAGFVLVGTLAWTFEITPAGLVLTKQVDRSKSFAHNIGKKLNKIIIGLLVVAVGLLFYDLFFTSSKTPEVQEEVLSDE